MKTGGGLHRSAAKRMRICISIIGVWQNSVKGVNKYAKIDISVWISPKKAIFSFPK
jgi:hypothetical protein